MAADPALLGMPWRRGVFLFVAALAGLPSTVRAAEAPGPKARFVYTGDSHFAPYDFLDSAGRPAGFNVELIQALARDAGVEVEIRLDTWDRARASFDAGRADLISLSHSEERARAYLWLVQTWTMHQCILFPTGRAAYPHGPKDLGGETIAVQERSAVEELLFDLEPPRPNLLPVATQADAVRLLSRGTASAVGGNSLTLRRAAALAGIHDLVEMPLRVVPYGLVARKGREPEFEWVARSMSRLREAGMVESLAERHLAIPSPARTLRDYAVFLAALVGVVAAVLGGAFAWSRSLRREVGLRTRELEAALRQKVRAEEDLLARGRALQESEERFERLSAASFEAIAITEDGMFVDGNQALAVMLGQELSELIGGKASAFVAPEHRELVVSLIKSGSEIPYSHLALRKDGSVFPVEVHARSIPYKGRIARVTALRDITERLNAEAALRASEKNYRDIVDFSPIGIYQARPDGVITAANLAFARILGYDRVEDVLNLSLVRDVYVDAEERARLIARYEAIGHGAHAEVRFKRRDGTPFWAEMASHAVKDREGKTVYFESFIQDIEARKAAEEALRSSEERYRLLFEGNPVPMVIYDLETLRFLAVNEAAVLQYGYSREELLGLSVPDLALPDDEHLKTFLASRHEHRPVLLRVGLRRQRRKDGSIIDVDMTSLALRFGDRSARLVLARDVSAELRAEEERERLHAAVERAGTEWQRTVDALDYCVLILDREGRVKRINHAAQALLEAQGTDGLESSIEAMGSQVPWPQAARAVALARKTGALASAQAVDETRGQTWDLSAYHAPSGDAADERIILVLRDVSRLVALRDSLRRSETMSAMGSLVAGVAHEVRNPLFSISATVDALESDLEGREEYAEYVNLLRSQVERLTRLMRDLLDYGKPPAIRIAPARPSELLRRSLRSCTALARERGATLREEIPPDLPPLALDASRMEQVFENLVANALQHSPRGGTVRVVAERSSGTDARIDFRVEDEGSGLLAADIPRLFEPFFSRRKGGTGLGLSVVQHIVEAHGGKVVAANRSEGGAVFTVTLPVSGTEEAGVIRG